MCCLVLIVREEKLNGLDDIFFTFLRESKSSGLKISNFACEFFVPITVLGLEKTMD